MYCLLNAFYGGKLRSAKIDGTYNIYEMARIKPDEYLELKNLGKKSLQIIAQAFENLGIVQNSDVWMKRFKQYRNTITLKDINEKLDLILSIINK